MSITVRDRHNIYPYNFQRCKLAIYRGLRWRDVDDTLYSLPITAASTRPVICKDRAALRHIGPHLVGAGSLRICSLLGWAAAADCAAPPGGQFLYRSLPGSYATINCTYLDGDLCLSASMRSKDPQTIRRHDILSHVAVWYENLSPLHGAATWRSPTRHKYSRLHRTFFVALSYATARHRHSRRVRRWYWVKINDRRILRFSPTSRPSP